MIMFFRSMHGRLFLILLAGMILTSAGTILLTHTRQQEIYDRVRVQHLTGEIAELVETLEKVPPPQRDEFMHGPHGMGIHGQLVDDAAPLAANRDTLLEDAIRQRLEGVEIVAERPVPGACGDIQFRWPRHMHEPPACAHAYLKLHSARGLA